MSRYKITDQHGLNFLTLTVVDWVDVFIRKTYKDIIPDSLRYCQKEKGLTEGTPEFVFDYTQDYGNRHA